MRVFNLFGDYWNVVSIDCMVRWLWWTTTTNSTNSLYLLSPQHPSLIFFLFGGSFESPSWLLLAFGPKILGGSRDIRNSGDAKASACPRTQVFAPSPPPNTRATGWNFNCFFYGGHFRSVTFRNGQTNVCVYVFLFTNDFWILRSTFLWILFFSW